MELIFKPESYFDHLCQDIQNAKKEILLEIYIFQSDSLGKKILGLLKNACERNVAVKLLIDGVGSRNLTRELLQPLIEAGGEVRIFRPVLWFWLEMGKALTLLQMKQMLSLFQKFNVRNHKKTTLIDNEIFYLGSFNISESHYSWRDTGMRIPHTPHCDGVHSVMQESFELTWRRSVDVFPKSSRNPRWFLKKNFFCPHLLLTHSPKERHYRNQKFFGLLNNARKKIWITTAYFVPTRQLIASLIQAGKRNIDVKLIVPGNTDIKWLKPLSTYFYGKLLKKGIRIFCYKPKVLHAKTTLVDNTLIVGSSNLDFRSIFHNLELDFVATEPSVIQKQEEQFLIDLSQCEEFTREQWKAIPLSQRILARLLLVFRYLM